MNTCQRCKGSGVVRRYLMDLICSGCLGTGKTWGLR